MKKIKKIAVFFTLLVGLPTIALGVSDPMKADPVSSKVIEKAVVTEQKMVAVSSLKLSAIGLPNTEACSTQDEEDITTCAATCYIQGRKLMLGDEIEGYIIHKIEDDVVQLMDPDGKIWFLTMDL